MKWFKHDSNAAVDAKIERLIMKYGLEGYGLYFYCLELIARSVEKHNLTFELEHDAEIIAHRTNMHYSRVQEMMEYMVELKLFENDRGVITCLKMATRTDDYIGRLTKTTQLRTNSEQTPNTLRTKSGLIEEKEEIERKKERASENIQTLKTMIKGASLTQ